MNSKSDSPPPEAKPLSLHRWSQRKHEAARTKANTDAATPNDAMPSAAGVNPTASAPAVVSAASAAATPNPSAPLPPVESLTPDSDFTAFFDAKAGVAETVKRAALKQLLRDPRFNVMDGLDTYIDDYTREDPIPDSVLKRLVQSRPFRDPNAEEQAEEQAQRDAAIGQAQGGASAELPHSASVPAFPSETTASSNAGDAPPDLPSSSRP
jgi:Protein of unknown function (DUF3306)